ncbi:permease [Abyssisolibacter fermentans]|uniref:permease n=1 Tax=Abyssisolibacter fermentans TaxID=1766203 RepID=UPI0008301F2D|nr:permease [Abyssisolibacter fermentans]
MTIFYVLVIVMLLVSYIADKKKTKKALKIALKKLKNILPAFLTMLIMVSIVLYLVPDAMIAKYLGEENILSGALIASLLGSISLMPGFIAFPLAKVLLSKGIKYCVIASFTTSLMMVGIITYPVEKKYFGSKLTIVRNIFSYVIVLILALIIGLAYGEVIIW